MTFYRKKDGNRTYGFETNMISFYQVKIPCFKRNVIKSNSLKGFDILGEENSARINECQIKRCGIN